MKVQIPYHRITNHPRRDYFKHYLFLLACGTLILYSCSDSFEPLKENNLYNFNISGYLDASADTQWVRVGTIRHSIDEPPDPTGITVTLEDLQYGETVVMKDSVFASRNVLNYWTTMDINHEQSYRITAAGTDGKSSTVSVSTPKELPPLYVTTPRIPPGARIYFDESIEHIADVQSVWYVILKSGTEIRRRIYRFPIRHTLSTTSAYFSTYSAFANHAEEQKQIEESAGGAEITIVNRQFFVAAGGPEWDDNLSSIVDLEYFLEGTASNVENGLGYVIGISSGWYPQLTCLTPDRSNYAPCEPREPFWYHE